MPIDGSEPLLPAKHVLEKPSNQSHARRRHSDYRHPGAGLADTFKPSVVGILPVLNNLEKLIDGEILHADGTILLAGHTALFQSAERRG